MQARDEGETKAHVVGAGLGPNQQALAANLGHRRQVGSCEKVGSRMNSPLAFEFPFKAYYFRHLRLSKLALTHLLSRRAVDIQSRRRHNNTPTGTNGRGFD